MNSTVKVQDVESYIAQFPEETKNLLQAIRTTICQEAPEAEECISYQMPAYKFNGILLYFAAYKHHIGLYPTPSAILAFEDELTDYKCAKGSIQFPLAKAFPFDLLKRIVAYRMMENTNKN